MPYTVLRNTSYLVEFGPVCRILRKPTHSRYGIIFSVPHLFTRNRYNENHNAHLFRGEAEMHALSSTGVLCNGAEVTTE